MNSVHHNGSTFTLDVSDVHASTVSMAGFPLTNTFSSEPWCPRCCRCETTAGGCSERCRCTCGRMSREVVKRDMKQKLTLRPQKTWPKPRGRW